MQPSDGWRWRRGGIAAEILQDVLGSAEGWFGVDDPIFAEERTQPGSEELGMGERREFSGQVQLTALEGRLQAGDELAAKHASQHRDGNEEAGMGSNPAGVLAGESAGGNDTVDMGMKLEFLVALLIEAAPTPFYRTILMTLYGTGVRRAELTHLKVSDIDSRRMVVHIQGGKGRQDRGTGDRRSLSCSAERAVPVHAAE